MTRLDPYASTLQEISRHFLQIAARESRWDGHALRSHAHVLDQIALELLLDSDQGH